MRLGAAPTGIEYDPIAVAACWRRRDRSLAEGTKELGSVGWRTRRKSAKQVERAHQPNSLPACLLLPEHLRQQAKAVSYADRLVSRVVTQERRGVKAGSSAQRSLGHTAVSNGDDEAARASAATAAELGHSSGARLSHRRDEAADCFGQREAVQHARRCWRR
eukprot:scaffold1182_cov124-Isochrysis_galbana.AAC.5